VALGGGRDHLSRIGREREAEERRGIIPGEKNTAMSWSAKGLRT